MIKVDTRYDSVVLFLECTWYKELHYCSSLIPLPQQHRAEKLTNDTRQLIKELLTGEGSPPILAFLSPLKSTTQMMSKGAATKNFECKLFKFWLWSMIVIVVQCRWWYCQNKMDFFSAECWYSWHMSDFHSRILSVITLYSWGAYRFILIFTLKIFLHGLCISYETHSCQT